MLLGMALFQLGIITGERSNRFYVTGAPLANGSGVVVAIWYLKRRTEKGAFPVGKRALR